MPIEVTKFEVSSFGSMQLSRDLKGTVGGKQQQAFQVPRKTHIGVRKPSKKTKLPWLHHRQTLGVANWHHLPKAFQGPRFRC